MDGAGGLGDGAVSGAASVACAFTAFLLLFVDVSTGCGICRDDAVPLGADAAAGDARLLFVVVESSMG